MKLPIGVAVMAGVAAAAGCGDDRRHARTVPDAAHAREVAADPYAVTCGDLARQRTSPEAARLVIHAEFALARDPALRERVAELTLNRAGRSVYFALTEVCKGRPPSFRPARAAVDGVRSGRYRAGRGRPG